MAAWQFSLHLIPRSRLRDLDGVVPARLDEDVWLADDSRWWASHKLTRDYASILDSVLPRMKQHWCRDVEAWGMYEADIVEISRGEGVSVRLDVRSLNRPLVDAVLRIAAESDCCLVTEDRMVIAPRLELLEAEIRQSGAFRFVVDPQGFLTSFDGMPPVS